MSLLDLLSGSWVAPVLGTAAIAMGAWAGVQTVRLRLAEADVIKVESKWRDKFDAAENTAKTANDNYRAQERAMLDEQERKDADARQIEEGLRNRVVAATAERDSLQQRFAAALRARPSGPAAEAPSADAGSAAAAPSSDLLADVFGQVDDMAGQYAATADLARQRGVTCEAKYEAARLLINSLGGELQPAGQ